MALASAGSLWVASSSHWANSRSGSSEAVKSPTVNRVGCSIGAVSDMSRGTRMSGPVRQAFRPLSYSGTALASLRLINVAALTLAVGGCAVSGQFGSMFSGKSDEARAQTETRALALDGDETTGAAGSPPASAKGV